MCSLHPSIRPPCLRIWCQVRTLRNDDGSRGAAGPAAKGASSLAAPISRFPDPPVPDALPPHRRAAVRQRPAPPRPPRRRLPPGRPRGALPPDEGPRCTVRLRLRRARRTDPAPRPRGGRRPAGDSRPVPRAAGVGARGVRDELRPLRPHVERCAPRDEPGLFSRDGDGRAVCQENRGAALRRRGRPLSRRPLRARHVSEMWIRGRLRRPVRKLRDGAQPERAHQSPEHALRHRARAARDEPLVPPARRPSAGARRLHRTAPRVEAERDRPGEVVARRRPHRPRHDARPPVGRARAAGGGRRRRRQGALRLVRRAHRLRLDFQRMGCQNRAARALARLLAERVDEAGPLYRQGQHRLPHAHLPGALDGLQRVGGGRCAAVRAAGERAGQRVLEPRRPQALDQPRLGRVGARGRRALRPGPPPLRARRDAPRDQRRRLHLGRLPGARQQRARRRAGQLRPPHAHLRPPLRRRHRPAARAALRR